MLIEVNKKKTHLQYNVDNAAVVHIVNSFVNTSPELMKELRRLNTVLDELGLRLRAEWILSI